MLLQKLKLRNIRSYTDEEVIFPEGSTLLSGDIGCGKSSILLAIEFALFGTSRPDLPAELLLRKGTTTGSVELFFQLNNQNIIIQRNLKKDKKSIKQVSGYLIINEVKKELTAVELKAEIIGLLGYPQDILTKNKNYIFRYTVYTPQEEMKFILQENEEARLDALRKIFNIDKYKNIRENTQIFLKKMRTKIAVLKTRLEPYEEEQESLKKIENEKKDTSENLTRLEKPLQDLRSKIDFLKKETDNLEKQQKVFQEIQQKFKPIEAYLHEKNGTTSKFETQHKNLKEEQESLQFPSDLTQESVNKAIIELGEKQNSFLTEKAEIKSKTEHLRQLIENSMSEIKVWKKELESVSEKETLQRDLHSIISQKPGFLNQQEEFDKSIKASIELETKNRTILNQAQELKSRISSLETCPTCVQPVSEDHKNNILLVEDQKILKAKTSLQEISKTKLNQTTNLQKNSEKLDEISKKEQLLTKVKLELEHALHKKTKLSEKENQIKEWVLENNTLMSRIQSLEKENTLINLQEELGKHRSKLSLLVKKDQVNQQIINLENQINKTNDECNALLRENISLKEKFINLQDNSKIIEEKRQQSHLLMNEEKQKAIKQAEWQTQLNHLTQQENLLKKRLEILTENKNTLIRNQELYHWLENYFLKLTYAIEKRVMIQIHHMFDQLFQEWFSILIEDETVFSRIDSTFTPIIEQNGYEVTFQNLSGGEKTSAALAYRLALNRVINDVIHDIKTKDILILDEPTDGFSSEQLEKVRDILDRLSLRQTILVSHEEKIESFVDNVIRVKKEAHVSAAQ